MAKTAIADVIIPSLFEKYVIERTATLSAFGASGIVESDPFFDALAAGGGQTVDMPFWQDVNPTRQILSDSASLNRICSARPQVLRCPGKSLLHAHSVFSRAAGRGTR